MTRWRRVRQRAVVALAAAPLVALAAWLTPWLALAILALAALALARPSPGRARLEAQARAAALQRAALGDRI